MKRGLVVMSWIIGIAGAAVLLRDNTPYTIIGIALLIWGNNLFEASRRDE